MKATSTLLAIATFAFVNCAAGYDVATHARITYSAFLHSSLGTDPTTFANLGIAKGADEKLETTYFDILNGTVREREPQDFDWNRDKSPAGIGPAARVLSTRIPGWLMRGAVREDDSAERTAKNNTLIFDAQPEPLDDPYGNFNRWCNHFFDPYRNRALELPLSTRLFCTGDLFASAPVWATGISGPFTVPLSTVEQTGRRNHFTVLDAREAMWRALTGYDKTRARRVAADKPTRDGYWATTFRALGDVLHLIQDMAQPQHTRNEDHGAGNAAWYEKYIDGRAKRLTEIVYDYRIGVLRAGNATPLEFPGHRYTPQFNGYGEFWSTGTGGATLTGKGLADYSSRGFLTPANAIGGTAYPSPSPNAASYARLRLAKTNGWLSEYLTGSVPDFYDGIASEATRMVRRTLWADSLDASGVIKPSVYYGFDQDVFDDRAALLIPRAVAYSAGILNHFFRGKLEISLPDAGFYALRDGSSDARPVPPETRSPYGFSKVKVKLKNTTLPVTPAGGVSFEQPMSNGVLVAVVRFRKNKCGMHTQWPGDAAAAAPCLEPTDEIVVSERVDVSESAPIPAASAERPSGDEFTFLFTDSPIPADAWNITLQIVYRGKLGAEPDAVVVATKDISEPSVMTFMNTTDFFTVSGKFYTPQTLAANPALYNLVRPPCVNRTGPTPEIYKDCYNRPDRFTVTAGTNPVTIAAVGDDVVMPRRLIRLEFLADLQSPVRLDWKPGDIRCDLPENPLIVPAYRAQYDAEDRWSYSVPSSLRGVKTWRSYLCYEDLGIVPTLPANANFTQLDNLTDEEESPTPVLITGW